MLCIYSLGRSQPLLTYIIYVRAFPALFIIGEGELRCAGRNEMGCFTSFKLRKFALM